MELSELIFYHENYSKLNLIRKNRNNIVPFVGAGISIQCGLYSWMDLLDQIAKDYFTTDEIKKMHDAGDCYAYADEIIKVVKNSDMIMKKIRQLFDNSKISLTDSPYILISSFSDLIVTTNYDTVLEEASRQNIHSSPLRPLLPCLEGQIDAAIQNNDRCLLKLHGSIEEESSIILTSDQYDKFYGKPGNRKNKPLPKYLKKIFTSKKLLFVGCSLDSDRTLDVLLDCIKQKNRISHFAIVPWVNDEGKRISRSRWFTNLGIEPIYFPEGDFDSVKKLLRYLAKDNLFTNKVYLIIKELTDDITSDTIYALINNSFYDTANVFPKLLDSITYPSPISYEQALSDKLSTLSESDTIYSILIFLFNTYVETSQVDNKNHIKNYFKQRFSELCLKEKSINELLEKRWSIKHNLSNLPLSNSWFKNLSQEEINNNAKALLNHLQYKNGMSFSDITHIYSSAKEFETCLGNKMEYHTRTRLLNSIGAFSYYYNDSVAGEEFLRKAIQLVNKSGLENEKEKLFLAKCYYNLALSLANQGKLKDALDAITKDIELNQQYKENQQLYARSLDLYASISKLLSPFEACKSYLRAAQIKEKFTKYLYTDKKEQNDIEASWATALFNIGLLCRDVGLFDSAYEYVLLANKIRSKILDSCNRDYCSSLNVQAELELILRKAENPSQIITIIDSKQSLPKGFDKIMGHTYYVCALYYFIKKDYTIAFDYSNRSLNVLCDEESSDFLQIVKSKLLLAISLHYIKNTGLGKQYQSTEKIINETIKDISHSLGNDSFYLIYPFKILTMFHELQVKTDDYIDKYNQILARYQNDKMQMKKGVNDYLEIIKN